MLSIYKEKEKYIKYIFLFKNY